MGQDHRKIIGVCEGPAGAGKSTLLERLAQIPNVAVIQRSLGKREFETLEAGQKSLVNDNVKLMQALLKDEPVILIDRCFASQLVYHTIRNDYDRIARLENFSLYLEYNLQMLEQDLAWRLGTFVTRKIDLFWMFLIPTATELRTRRINGGKEYPHSEFIEIHHYKNLSNQMVGDRSQVLRPSYGNQADQDYIVDCFSNWVSLYPDLELEFTDLWKIFAGVKA